MLLNLTEEQIIQLAPDAASVKAGKGLATKTKWVLLEHSDRAIWGHCQGSGKTPYQTVVDTKNVAFKCSCPSRKFPCKHGLGLLFLYAAQTDLFKEADEPDWVTAWLSKREEKAEKKEQKAKGVKGIAANGELETIDANEANKDQFIRVDQRGNFFTNFGKNFLYQYNNPGRYSLYNMPKETPVEQAKEKIEAAQKPQNEAVRRELASTRVYNNHRYNEREINWKQAGNYGITPDVLKNSKDSLERMLQGKSSAVAFHIAKPSELGRESGDAKLSLFRDENGAVKFDLHYIRQAPKVGEDYRGYTLTEDDLKTLNRTGNLGKTVDMVIDYRTKETKPCYLSKDPVTNELFHMPVEQARVPRKVKDYTLSKKEYEAAVRGEEVPIRFKSNNGKYLSLIHI